MSLEQRARALLALIEDDRQRGCSEARDAGHREARDIVRAARAAARARLRETLAVERARLRERLGAADARLANEQRQHDQRRSAALLAAAWERLPEELERRWADPQARERWIRFILEAAARILPGAESTATHAPDGGMRAGVRVRSGANLVDGSLEGLIEDRAAIEARLLDHLEGPP